MSRCASLQLFKSPLVAAALLVSVFGCAGTPNEALSASSNAAASGVFPSRNGACPGPQTAFDFGAVRVLGRFEPTPEQSLRFAWPGVKLASEFSGPTVHVDLEDSGHNRFYVYVDGVRRPGKLVAKSGRHCYELAADLPAGNHELVLERLTEPLLGESAFFAFRTAPGGHLALPKTKETHSIEVIGDSISSGYGVEGANRYCHFSAETQNHALSYGALVARKFNAALSTVAWSGKGVFSNRGSLDDLVPLPVLFERALPTKEQSRWDFQKFQPELVIINLGTNDFAPENKDTGPFPDAYLGFVRKVRAVYPRAAIFCTLGPLLSDTWPPNAKVLSTARSHIKDAVFRLQREGDSRVFMLEHPPANDLEGWGCDWHPNQVVQARMADELSAAISRELKW